MKETFSSDLKRQLCQDTSEEFGISLNRKKSKKPCCCEAFLRAAFSFGGTPDGSVLRSENEAFLEICEFLLISLYDTEAKLKVSSVGKIKALMTEDPSVLSFMMKDGEPLFYEKCPKCGGYFLRGAFLASGTMLDPKKGLHLEIVTQNESSADALAEHLESLDMAAKISKRGEACVIYYKETSKIEDFLTLIGAQSHALKVMEQGIMNDVRNTVNRQNNSENANLSRNIDYTQRLLAAIDSLRESGAFSSLPDKLREAAELREKYPEDTLAQLAERTNGKISKSGLAHRLKKISEIENG
ncbi:MAG: DNA-binding protein WhiA [Ruminococcaceae bacterium]|nr:DNA-binding protein WhiA [Oscillospiraceae bacterium]